MKIINPSIELVTITNNALQLIEQAGRTAYKSENKITDNSAESFCSMIVKCGHNSVLEHASATFRIICDRGVLAEITRHRIGVSFTVESTRYCNYSKKGMQFVLPSWLDKRLCGYYKTFYNDNNIPCVEFDKDKIELFNKSHLEATSGLNEEPCIDWLLSAAEDELRYNRLIEKGWKPQQARAILPNCVKTEIVMTANFREWLHFLKLRTSPQAHPDMQVIAKMIENKLNEMYPTIFMPSELQDS